MKQREDKALALRLAESRRSVGSGEFRGTRVVCTLGKSARPALTSRGKRVVNKIAAGRQHMTSAVFSVARDAPAARAVNDTASLEVHPLFVVDEDGVLVGVIGVLDVVEHLAE